MKLVIRRSHLSGRVEIPASKSHTIRAVFVGCRAEGLSELIKPLDSLDTRAAIRCGEAFGAEVTRGENWHIKGMGDAARVPENVVDVANSGTSIAFFTGLASTLDGYTVLTGDEQVRRRPIQPLLDCLSNLGAEAFSTRNTGTPPLVVKGKLKGGRTDVEGRTSQYTSALLFNCPMAEGDSELRIEDPKEKPYVEMTLGWLDKQGVRYGRDGFSSYVIPGGQQYVPFRERIPGDFSTATFFLCGASIVDSDVTLLGLDMNDTQGDKKVVSFLQEMGADITIRDEGLLIRGGDLTGTTLDLGDTPDALPALAVVGCFARGKTKLTNVLSARWKETDRIKVMCEELSKLGARVEELPDGMIVSESRLGEGVVSGHGDHRVVMALSLAGLRSAEGVQVETAEALSVTVPNFVDLMRDLGASITVTES